MSWRATEEKRRKRVRAKILKIVRETGCPRLTVFRSNRYTYAQIIDDKAGKTLVAASERNFPLKGTKIARAKRVGQILAQQALAKKIAKVVFDRGGYKFHGRVKALAEGAREGGLKF